MGCWRLRPSAAAVAVDWWSVSVEDLAFLQLYAHRIPSLYVLKSMLLPLSAGANPSFKVLFILRVEESGGVP